MKFKYTAKNQGGVLQVGTVKAASQAAVLNILSGHGLYVLSLEPVDEDMHTKSPLAFLKKVKRNDLMVFTRQLATLLGAKIPLADTLKTLKRQTLNETLKEVIAEIASDVDTGFSLSQALSKHPDIFSEFFLNMVKSAEVTGRMEEVMTYLADYLEKEGDIIMKVRNALIYPAFIIVLFGGVGVFLVTVVLPQLKPIFEDAGIELPFFTKMLMNSGAFMAKWWWLIFIALVVLATVVLDYLNSKEGKEFFDEFKLKIPILGKLYKHLFVSRFAESTSVLIKGGIPIARSIEITARTIGNVVYERVLIDSSQAIRRGELISTAISRHEEHFPPFTYQMIAVGETTGKLDELLDRVSSFYTREVDVMVSNLVELIQPLLIVGIGGAVGLLFASIILPIFQLAQGF